MTPANSHDLLAAALVAAQADMPAVEKTAKANYGKYATLDHLIAKTRSPLNKQGLTITQWPTSIIDGLGNVRPALRTVLMHSSGQFIEDTTPLVIEKETMQGLGAALTYAKRYAWSAALGISTDEDDDANSLEPPKDAAAKPKPAAKPAIKNTPEQHADALEARATLLLDVAAGIERLGPSDKTWTDGAVLGAASRSYGRPIHSLRDLTDSELQQILGAMPPDTQEVLL